MKKQIPLVFMLSLCIVMSCKKKNETKILTSSTGAVPTYKIKTVKTFSTGDTTLNTYYYDAGRLVKLTASDGSYYTMTWTSGQMVYSYFQTANSSQPQTLTYKLNGLGQTVNVSGNFFSFFLNETYQYNADGYMSATTLIDNDTTTTTYTITGGNVTGSRMKDSYSTNTSLTEFYMDKPNTIGNFNVGFGIMGKQNANLEKTITTITKNGSQSDTAVVSNTYEFDTKNRVSKKTSFNGFGNTVTLYSYYE